MANPRRAAWLLFFGLCYLAASPGSSAPLETNGFTDSPYQIEIWAANVSGARGMVIDDVGDVLVVATGLGGIYSFWEESSGQVNRTMIVNNTDLNHGITLHGNFLYASSSSTVWRWNYKAGQRSMLTGQLTLIIDINQNEFGQQITTDHVTRSLAIDAQNTLYVSVGSTSNVDNNSFRARMRSFSLGKTVPNGGFNFVADGTVFADGLRNEVGLGFDGSGRLWGVENGADDLNRKDLGGDIHDDNPAEELNLFNSTPGTFYGYPFCWSEYDLPTYGTGPGSQWAWPTLENATITDAWCKNTSNVRHPEVAMQAHSAPLGITFYNGTNCGNQVRNTTNHTSAYAFPCEYIGDAFVAFHGSWDRNVPTGFKVVKIAFDNRTGMPVSKNDSSVSDIFGAVNSQTECGVNDAGRATCLRPVDVKFDSTGVLMVTSDASSEIIRVTLTNSTVSPSPSSSPGSSPGSAPAPSASSAPSSSLVIGMTTFFRAIVPLLVCLFW